MTASRPLRNIKSFVVRQGRMTPGQKQAFSLLSQRYCIDLKALPDWHKLTSPFNAVVLEIGFGMGDALCEYARHNPDILYLGIEVHPPGIGHVLRLIDQECLNNIRILQGDAVEILKSDVPDKSLNQVHLFFPDPWPKARHHKRRIVNSEFAGLIAQKLKLQGIFHLATDWQNYAEWMQEVLILHPAFKKISEERGNRPVTKFEQRGLSLGHSIFDFQFMKQE